MNTNLIERFHGSLKDRIKVMRGMRKIETARLLLDGWLVHYNFFRTHETLETTPAEKAGVKFPYENWMDIVRSQKEITIVLEEDKYPPDKTYRVRAYPVFEKPKRSRKAKPKRRQPFKRTEISLKEIRV